jgi:signal transduction histidine kinase
MVLVDKMLPPLGLVGSGLRRVPAVVIDAVVDVIVALAAVAVDTVAIRVAVEPGARPADALAYGLGVLMGALLLVRRRWPLGVLAATTVALLVYYSLGYPGVTPALPLAAALYTAAAAGELRWSLTVIAFFIGADLYVPLAHRHQAPLLLVVQVTERALGMVALALLGETVRSRRLRLAAAQERLGEVQRERALETARRLTEERLRIAREVHDIVGHTIAAITIHAALADEQLDHQPAKARSALRMIRTASRAALLELRAAVGLLRAGGTVAAQGQAQPEPVVGLVQLDELVDAARGTGLRVAVTRNGDLGSLPAVVDLSAYRIVQESLTNVTKHAHATTVTVAVDRQPTELVIEVTNDGRGGAAAANGAGNGRAGGSGGRGIGGMTERAAALGGRLETGPTPGGGFRVRATLPVLAVPA